MPTEYAWSMPRVPIVETGSAAPEVRTVYADFLQRMSFPAPPNFIKAQGHSTTVVRATWDLVRGVLVTGLIPRFVKEMMFVVISKDRECRYCEAAHIACCRVLGVDQELLDCLIYDIEGMTNQKHRDIILFGLKCSRNPQSLVEADFERLRQHGLGHPEIVEVIAMSGLAVYANIMADATAIEADKMFDEVAGQQGR
jgi:uncharacterized peroxidase-related enzyme